MKETKAICINKGNIQEKDEYKSLYALGGLLPLCEMHERPGGGKEKILMRKRTLDKAGKSWYICIQLYENAKVQICP